MLSIYVASYTLHLTHCILQNASYILHLTQCILHNASYTLRLMHCILHITSYKLHKPLKPLIRGSLKTKLKNSFKHELNNTFIRLGSCDNIQTERSIFEDINWPMLQVLRTDPSSLSVQLVCPAGSSSWSVQLVRSAGPSSHGRI